MWWFFGTAAALDLKGIHTRLETMHKDEDAINLLMKVVAISVHHVSREIRFVRHASGETERALDKVREVIHGWQTRGSRLEDIQNRVSNT